MTKKKALVIDYEPRGLEQICAPLRRAGFEVETASNGLDGFVAFERIKPDVTLLEAMLPKRHGFEVAQQMKSTAHGAKSAVIIVTAVYKGRKYRTQALHHYGCDAFLEKPVDPDHLIDVVRGLVGDAESPDEPESEASGGGGQPADPDTTEAEIVDRLDSVLGDVPPPGKRTPNASVVAFDAGRVRRRASISLETSVVPPHDGNTLRHAVGGGATVAAPAPAPASKRHPRVHTLPAAVPVDAVARHARVRMAFLVTVLIVCAAALVVRML